MTRTPRIVVLTGAGISAESGVSTFRDKDGIWARYDMRKVATPEGYAADPRLVHEFYNQRRRDIAKVKPNAAHVALAQLEAAAGDRFLLVTQNIDNLHEAGGSRRLIHMHGELMKALCTQCDSRHAWNQDMGTESHCPACARPGGVRPDVVWFGEMPYHMAEIERALTTADLFISIGTSGNVYPAAGFVEIANEAGAHTVELNLEPSEGASSFREAIHGPATQVVPAYVEKLIAAYRS